MKSLILTTIVRTKEINLTVVVENFLIHSEMFRGHIEKATVESESTVGTVVRKVTEDPIIMTDIVQEEIITQETIEKSIEILGEEDLEIGLAAAIESIIVVITKSKSHKLWIELFVGDMNLAILKEIDVTTKVVAGEVTRGIANTRGGKENLMFIPTFRKKLKLK